MRFCIARGEDMLHMQVLCNQVQGWDDNQLLGW